jgi:hypothetical protein
MPHLAYKNLKPAITSGDDNRPALTMNKNGRFFVTLAVMGCHLTAETSNLLAKPCVELGFRPMRDKRRRVRQWALVCRKPSINNVQV